MGYISRKLLPACENVCLCCPALKPSSRRPVKRYKKLLSEIFLKNLQDGVPNERKIIKLCEYAAKNPSRIPKISSFIEQKCYKELQSEHFNYIKVTMEVYCKLLSLCKGQMAYFARNLLSVVTALLDAKKLDHLRILGCQTLTRFIYNQADGTYACCIESIVPKVTRLAREDGEEHNNQLVAASLQCLSSMVWFMSEYSYIFSDFDEIIYAILDNHGVDKQPKDADEGLDKHHNWVDEVIRCEARAGPILHDDGSLNNMIIQPLPEMKNSDVLTREEYENPKVWSQICIQKLAELAKESTTMRRILDPMFTYFDLHKHWAPKHGLALNVLLNMACLSKISGNEQFILIALVRHLDNKDIMHDPQLKSNIVQIATSLVKQLRLRSVIAEIGIVSNLCRHLRRSLQVTVEMVRPEESSWNFLLQDSIEDCLLEIVKGIGDVSPLYDMMTITLEKLASIAIVARATIGSLLILARIISLTSSRSHSELIFPEALLVQLFKAMLHPDVEARVGAHMIFSVLIAGTLIHPRYEPECLYESKKLHFRTTPAFASTTALLEKLQREYGNGIKQGNDMQNESSIKDINKGEWKHGWIQKSSPCFHKLSCSIIDRTAISNYSHAAESCSFILNEDQIGQLLCAFWGQAHQPDNFPSNYEAIALSFHLTVLSFHRKNTSHSTTAQLFQFLLSLINSSLDPNGTLPPSSRRSLFTLSAALLAFTAKLCEIPELIDSLKHLIAYHVDPYLKVGDDFLLYAKPQANLKEYGSEADQGTSLSSLAELRKKMIECGPHFIDVIVQHLSVLTNMDKNDIAKLISATFTPEDGDWTLWMSIPFVGWDFNRALTISSEESFPFAKENLSSSMDGDLAVECLSTDLPRLHPSKPEQPSIPQFMSVGQLLESALHVAGQVSGSSVSTSPLPYGTMASQCEAFGMGMRKKLSTWLVSGHDEVLQNPLQAIHGSDKLANGKVQITDSQQVLVGQSWRVLRLPPASPFDNFMRAAGC
ncbi:uncharacterized protein LOC110105315 isoform X1 [Dendrobium catenatum]|uniref:uncharacterized protein LOC110105315 isoform X1 n=2 Tax=Dendrobium catenatum TaxID=906689 RepID=UPI0009F7472A|nr:uncharacterized protein LOC110105315 isoform X1 [Dendrobium catenatum]XP_020690416.1 uncharacterized protein LOC110105315 isoform X1 [Dendrobium catenatum]XP_020690417.1 uncharacterized protein LOC110105315 isoform X1 [Dendrobium catenatum]XP_020690418.1 uncharacterized protein LOC110105315 isoform X1 [Dendrobium catenatum]XP_028548006.1 uncharacterized protein LOC110105315 isoform X1 [Dendrobium catenatum]